MIFFKSSKLFPILLVFPYRDHFRHSSPHRRKWLTHFLLSEMVPHNFNPRLILTCLFLFTQCSVLNISNLYNYSFCLFFFKKQFPTIKEIVNSFFCQNFQNFHALITSICIFFISLVQCGKHFKFANSQARIFFSGPR